MNNKCATKRETPYYPENVFNNEKQEKKRSEDIVIHHTRVCLAVGLHLTERAPKVSDCHS